MRALPDLLWPASFTSANSYNAKVHPHLLKLKDLLGKLSDRAQLRPEVVIVRHPFNVTTRQQWDSSWIDWSDFVAEGQDKKLGRTPDGEIEWQRLDFNWPLWILFSSGTTGSSSSFLERILDSLLSDRRP